MNKTSKILLRKIPTLLNNLKLNEMDIENIGHRLKYLKIGWLREDEHTIRYIGQTEDGRAIDMDAAEYALYRAILDILWPLSNHKKSHEPTEYKY